MSKRVTPLKKPAITLDQNASAPLYRQLYERLRDFILAGQLEAGTRLPSTRVLAREVGPEGIHVNAVAPGGIETEMTRGYDYGVENIPIPRMGQPEDVAQAVVFLASQMSNYVTGAVLDVNGGIV